MVEERIHECQAQADLCIGIDEEVCVCVCACMRVCYFHSFMQAVSDYEATEKKIRQLNEQVYLDHTWYNMLL